MKLKQFIEEYIDTFKQGSRTFEIFKNPSPKEIKSIIDKNIGIRFFAHAPTKTVYAFNGYFFHTQASDKIRIAKDYMDNPNVIGGTALLKKNKLVVDYVHDVELKVKENMAKKKLKKNWSFVDKYFVFQPLLKRYRKSNGLL